MNAVAATAVPAAAASACCHHCGQPAGADALRATFAGAERAFCCEGCLAAAQWIVDAHLDDYYRLRTAEGAKVQPDLPDLSLWDRDDVLAEHARTREDGCREITLVADGMRCAACAWLIDRALSREPGVREAGANAVTGRVRLVWDPRVAPLSQPLRRLAALGYRPWLATGEQRERARRSERNRWLLRLGIAGLGAMQAMMFAEALYLDTTGSMAIPTRDFLRWITFLVATPVVFYAGWPFLAGMARELRGRRPGMDTLVAASTLLAWAASAIETVRGGAHVWYDAAVMFVFLLLAARMLEQRARAIASAQVDALARARPAFAVRERADGGRESVPLAALAVGDVVCLGIGDTVPADGELLEPAAFEEALLTGESHPVARAAGERVYAGTLCRERPARLRVTATGAATRLSQLARLVEEAQAHRPPLARVADRVASVFVVALLLLAALTWFGWRLYAPERAFEVALALLVISCPCALSLAVPTALAVAHGALARMGVLALRPDALERLADVDTVVFDKTGTLTDPHPALERIDTFGVVSERDALAIAAALERDSGHPLAQAFAAHDDGRAVREVVAVGGRGIEGVIDGRRWRLGQAGFAVDGAQDDGQVWLGVDGTAAARFVLGERVREDAPAALASLRAAGLSLQLASGDGAEAVARTARTLGIDAAQARLLPEDKLERIRALQHDGRRVAMVGDGLNDAPVLAGADVSFAMDSGAALAHRSADFVLTRARLDRLPAAFALARRTRAIVRQNFAWAVGYNVVALPLAMLGLVTPWIAALGMAVSSLTVTLNALRLARREAP